MKSRVREASTDGQIVWGVQTSSGGVKFPLLVCLLCHSGLEPNSHSSDFWDVHHFTEELQNELLNF